MCVLGERSKKMTKIQRGRRSQFNVIAALAFSTWMHMHYFKLQLLLLLGSHFFNPLLDIMRNGETSKLPNRHCLS
jgi:hypothetical protein